MAKSNIGYLLPDGEAYTDEMACIVLFYPDMPEYRRALFGSLDYLGTWLAWERDDDKRGIDAGRAWSEAVALTRECIEMNACETMLSLLTEIRDNTGVYCCDVVDISDGDQYTDEVEDGVGDVPQNVVDAGYASSTSDWAGFDDYKCIIAHLMVDNLYAQTAKTLTYMLPSGAVLGGVAALAAIAAVILTGGGAALVYGIVLAVALTSGLYAAASLLGEAGLSSLVDDIDDNHDALACAIYHADGSADAVIALKAEIDELFSVAEAAFLKSLNIPAQLKALYGGRYDQQDIAQILADEGYDPEDFDCSCVIPTTPTDLDIWAVSWLIEATGDVLATGVGPSDPIRIWIEGPFLDREVSIINNGEYHFTDAPFTDGRVLMRPQTPPAGYDDESTSHPDIVVLDGPWQEEGEQFLYTAYAPSGTHTFTFKLSEPRIFADIGSGYEWFDASMETIHVYTHTGSGKLTYSLAENWLSWQVSSSGLTTAHVLYFTMLPLIPD